jgi:peptide/nickel transport system ATP-binding protein
MATPIVDIQGLHVAFSGKEVVHDFNLTIHPGEIVSVVGESGSGKSVSALLSMGLLSPNAEVKAAKALFQGQELLHFSSSDWAQLRSTSVSMVFQDPMTALHPTKRIGTQLSEVLQEHTALSATEIRARITQALEEVEVPEPAVSLEKYPFQMSGGQRQRVVIAMAMLLQPALIIADEPTTALDKEVEGKVLDLLRRLVTKRGTALWLISHDLELVADFSDRVLVLFRGTTVEQGPAKEIFTAAKHPYTQGLLGCRPPKEGRPYPLPVLDDFLEEKERLQTELATPVQENPVLEIRNLKIAFAQSKGWSTAEKTVVEGFDMTLFKGETLGLIGPSGSGKSTIGRDIVALVETSNGSINYTCEKHKVSFVFQDPFSALNGAKTIGSILGAVLKKHHASLGSKERAEKAAALLEEVGLSREDLKKKPAAFSGGQRQRIGIARALAVAPEILICDESVSALDVSVQSQVLNLLNEIKLSRGLSMIFISHDPDVVRYMCDRIITLTPII